MENAYSKSKVINKEYFSSDILSSEVSVSTQFFFDFFFASRQFFNLFHIASQQQSLELTDVGFFLFSCIQQNHFHVGILCQSSHLLIQVDGIQLGDYSSSEDFFAYIFLGYFFKIYGIFDNKNTLPFATN
jgi:hypothetical protein